MGLRTASVRRPDPEVMAPALPDTIQAQTFNISSKNHLGPASPINSFEPGKYLPGVSKNSAPTSPLNTDDLSISLENLDSIDLNSKKQLIEDFLGGEQCASGSTLPQNMNVSSSPMDDREDKMGLQNTGLTISNGSKGKNSGDVDQLFNATLDGNVEDIMQQVIKSIENSEQLNNPSDLNEDLDLNIDKELLEHVDNMINISMDDNQDDLETAQKIKENQANLLLTDLWRKHARLERRLDFIRRRCYKLETKLLGQHVSGEVSEVFEQVHRSLKKSRDGIDNSKSLGHYSKDFEDDIKPMSSNAAKLLLRKLDMAVSLQANNAARQKNASKYFGSGSIETSGFRNTASGQYNIPQWSLEHKHELQKVSEQLYTQLRLVQDEIDSEATESSSGGESCDELLTYNNPHQQYLSIQKRALWKYSTDRAAIASRWTWLQSQISDLEYRIRQHTELLKQIHADKGIVQLGDVPNSTPIADIAAGHESKPAVGDGTSAVNGYVGQLPGALCPKVENEDLECHQCARTRPLINFRKRRLVQVAGLHAVSKKAARPSTVRCSCVPALEPCALCTGRVDPTHPRDPPETLGKTEKVALLDPGFHPVLSLSEDCSQKLHLEAIMKLYEWQQRTSRMKTMKILHKREQGEPKSSEHRTKKLDHRKKFSRLKPSTVTALTEKLKNKLKRRKVGRPAGIGKFKKRQSHSSLSLQNSEGGAEDAEVEAAIGGGSTNLSGGPSGRLQFDSPGNSPLLQMQSISGYKQHSRNSRSDSYDIDNIVIPYSVAASTRVEKLQYKEILTPKWRIAEAEPVVKLGTKNNGSVVELGEDSDVEDLSEEAIVARHDRSEYDEKKRFLSYLKLPYGRQRSHKRHDSIAESSRATTPDATSPHPDGAKCPESSLLSSPPPTPCSSLDDSLHAAAIMRKRTVSQSRIKEEIIDEMELLPYEVRAFPLTDADFEHMVQEMPDVYREIKTNFRAQDTGEDGVSKGNGADSADSESTESAVGDDPILEDDDETLMEDEDEEEEDPNDPEWTDAEKTGHKDKHHRR